MVKKVWEVVAIQGYGVGKRAAVALVIVALLPIALPSLCLLSFFGFWLALPLALLTLGFLLLKKVFVTNSHASQEIFVSDARVASGITMRAIGDGAHSHGHGLRIDPPAEGDGNATQTPAATVGKGKDKVEEIAAPFELSVASPSSKPPVMIILRADENSSRDAIHPVDDKKTLREDEDRADSVVALSEAVKEPNGDGDRSSATAIAAEMEESNPEELPTKVKSSGSSHESDRYQTVADIASAAQANAAPPSTLTPPAKGTPTHDQKKKAAKHHHHHHHHHHRGRRHDHA